MEIYQYDWVQVESKVKPTLEGARKTNRTHCRTKLKNHRRTARCRFNTIQYVIEGYGSLACEGVFRCERSGEWSGESMVRPKETNQPRWTRNWHTDYTHISSDLWEKTKMVRLFGVQAGSNKCIVVRLKGINRDWISQQQQHRQPDHGQHEQWKIVG